jgi:hypothetical protein
LFVELSCAAFSLTASFLATLLCSALRFAASAVVAVPLLCVVALPTVALSAAPFAAVAAFSALPLVELPW